MAEQLTNWARWLKRGDTCDPEDFRLTHRLGVARGILRGLGIEPTWPEHDADCILHPDNRAMRCFGVNYRDECGKVHGKEPAWPEWVGNATFNAAMALADAVQTERGGWNRAQAGLRKDHDRGYHREPREGCPVCAEQLAVA